MKSGNLLAWGSAQLFFMLSVLAAIVFAILSDSIERQLHLNSSDLGLLGGVFFVTYAAGQLVLGILISRVKARLVLVPTALLSALGAFLFSISTGLHAALIARALMGLGFSSTFVGVIYLTSRRYGTHFALVSSISQSLTNICGALLGITSALLPILIDFQAPFQLLGILFLISALFLFLFVDDAPLPPVSTTQLDFTPLLASFSKAAGSKDFWTAVVFYCGTFGTLLAFADLWNIQFQVDFFRHSVQQSSMLNAMIPLGVTLGALTSGWWAEKSGLALPARSFSLLTLCCFAILIFFKLPLLAAGAIMFLLGCGFGSSTLGLTLIHAHLAAEDVPLATSLTVTAACLFGAVLQPLVGSSIGAALLGNQDHHFHHYQSGAFWLLVSTACAAFASFRFPSPAPDQDF